MLIRAKRTMNAGQLVLLMTVYQIGVYTFDSYEFDSFSTFEVRTCCQRSAVLQ
jgi:hypothetical protein